MPGVEDFFAADAIGEEEGGLEVAVDEEEDAVDGFSAAG